MRILGALLAAYLAWAVLTHHQSEIRYTYTPPTTHATINTQEGGTP